MTENPEGRLGPPLNLAAVVEFQVLGPLEVSRAGTRVDVGAGRQRALLALLLVHAGVFADLDEFWGFEKALCVVDGGPH